MAANIAMIAITTKSSMSVKAPFLPRTDTFLILYIILLNVLQEELPSNNYTGNVLFPLILTPLDKYEFPHWNARKHRSVTVACIPPLTRAFGRHKWALAGSTNYQTS